MKGLINSVWSTVVVDGLFTVMGHTQANQEVNDGTYCSFNLSPFPIWLFYCHSKHCRTWKSLLQTIGTLSSSRSPNKFLEPFDLSFKFVHQSNRAYTALQQCLCSLFNEMQINFIPYRKGKIICHICIRKSHHNDVLLIVNHHFPFI